MDPDPRSGRLGHRVALRGASGRRLAYGSSSRFSHRTRHASNQGAGCRRLVSDEDEFGRDVLSRRFIFLSRMGPDSVRSAWPPCVSLAGSRTTVGVRVIEPISLAALCMRATRAGRHVDLSYLKRVTVSRHGHGGRAGRLRSRRATEVIRGVVIPRRRMAERAERRDSAPSAPDPIRSTCGRPGPTSHRSAPASHA